MSGDVTILSTSGLSLDWLLSVMIFCILLLSVLQLGPTETIDCHRVRHSVPHEIYFYFRHRCKMVAARFSYHLRLGLRQEKGVFSLTPFPVDSNFKMATIFVRQR